MSDLTKAQSNTRTTPSDIKSKSLNLGAKNTLKTVDSLDLSTSNADGKSNEVRVEGKMAENLASLTQLLLDNKNQLTPAQLAEILNVPMDSSTQPLLEQLGLLLKGPLAPTGGLLETDSSAGVQKAVAELLSKQHGVSVKLESGAQGGAQVDHPGRKYNVQQGPSYGASATSVGESSNPKTGSHEIGGNSLHSKLREGSDGHKGYRRTSGNKDPLGLQEPLSAKDKVQNYLERFEQDSQSGSTGTGGFKSFSQPQWK